MYRMESNKLKNPKGKYLKSKFKDNTPSLLDEDELSVKEKRISEKL